MTNSDRDFRGPTRVRVCAANLASSDTDSFLKDLAMVDVIVRRDFVTIDESSIRESLTVDAFLADLQEADVVATPIAGTLRAHLPSTQPRMPWICLAKLAIGLSAGGNPPSLAKFADEYGVEAERTGCLAPGAKSGATAEMWAAALVVAALVRAGCPIRRQILLSQVITRPYMDLPAFDDDAAWRNLPDDLLAGLQRCSHDRPGAVVERACREVGRRQAAGHVPNFHVINWCLPGVAPYLFGEDLEGL